MKNSFLKSSMACISMAAVAALSGCGALSSPERSETPSALILKAQEAYDLGKYSEAVTLLEAVVQKDPANVLARARLAYSYLGTAEVSMLNLIKSKLPSSSGSPASSSGNINSLTQNSGLPAAKIEELNKKSSSITSIKTLRNEMKEFATFQKAFDVLCPVLPSSTISKLGELSSNIKEALNLSNCGAGSSAVNSDAIFAAIFLSLVQVSTLQPVFLGTEADGKTFTIEAKAKQSSDKISSLSSVQTNDPSIALANLKSLNDSLTNFNSFVNTIDGEIIKYCSAQITILSAVVNGSNLPTDIKTSITSLETSLKTAISAVNNYSSKAQSAASGAGGTTGENKVAQSLNSAKSGAQKYFQTVTDAAEKEKTCKNLFCVAQSSQQTDPASFLPTGCQTQTYVCTP